MSGKNTSLNSYSHHAPLMDWINQYFEFKNDFDEKHSLGSQQYSFFKRFLRDAELLDASGFTKTAEVIDSMGLDKDAAWAIMLVNLCYQPQLNWYVKRVGFLQEYSKALLASMMVDDGAKEGWTNDIFSSLVRMSELPLGKVGVGQAIKEKSRATAIIRNPWHTPDSVAVLYSLYKFAEACGGEYQFRLRTLMDDSIERDGVSPSRIFGLDSDTMVQLLNSLSINYPEFIHVAFTLDLDTITLRPEKSSADVLQLFVVGVEA